MPNFRRQLPLVLVFLGLTAPAFAQGPQFDYPADPEFVILEYSVGHAMLPETDEPPRLQLYGDGRVVVHYPDTMRRAGDWELRLSHGEVRALLARLESHGVLDFDPAAAKRHRAEAEAARRAREGTLFSISDDTLMGIVVRLSGYTPSTGAPSATDVRREIEWRNVQSDARRYPGVAALVGLAAAEREIQGILERDDLERIGGEGSLRIRE